MTENYSERIENALNDIQKIQLLFRLRYGQECLADKEIEEVLKIAKAEHKELEQYRAIGTIKKLEVCKAIAETHFSNACLDMKIIDELKEYKEIGTVEECREARERQDFTEDDISQIKFALEYLHDVDLSNYGEENIKALESVMRKLNMDFIDWYA